MESDIYIVSSEPIEQKVIDEIVKDSERSFIERIRENPNIIADYCGETPLEDYLSGKKSECRGQEKKEMPWH